MRIIWALLISCILLGCGVKGPPSPWTNQAPAIPPLSAVATPDGVRISFSTPKVSRPDQEIIQVRFRYAYQPIGEVSDCPSCPPPLTQTRYLPVPPSNQGGTFAWLDDQIPAGYQAFYRAEVIDQKGRESKPSQVVHAFNLPLPNAPEGLTVQSLGNGRLMNWSALIDTQAQISGEIAYQVQRRGVDGLVTLNNRPLSGTQLWDHTANPSLTYRYRIISVRAYKDILLVTGQPGEWVKSPPIGRESGSPPEDLIAVATEKGIYIRFEPSRDPEIKKYSLEKRETGGNWEIVYEGSANTFIDEKVKINKTYQYRVWAIDSDGDLSEPSDIVEIWNSLEKD